MPTIDDNKDDSLNFDSVIGSQIQLKPEKEEQQGRKSRAASFSSSQGGRSRSVSLSSIVPIMAENYDPEIAQEATQGLPVAALNGKADEMRDLLNKGADPTTQFDSQFSNKRSTALHFAAINGHENIILLLLKLPQSLSGKRIDPEAFDVYGNTPLMVLCQNQSKDPKKYNAAILEMLDAGCFVSREGREVIAQIIDEEEMSNRCKMFDVAEDVASKTNELLGLEEKAMFKDEEKNKVYEKSQLTHALYRRLNDFYKTNLRVVNYDFGSKESPSVKREENINHMAEKIKNSFAHLVNGEEFGFLYMDIIFPKHRDMVPARPVTPRILGAVAHGFESITGTSSATRSRRNSLSGRETPHENRTNSDDVQTMAQPIAFGPDYTGGEGDLGVSLHPISQNPNPVPQNPQHVQRGGNQTQR